MELFALFRHGCYRHECGGIFSSKEKAAAAKVSLEGQEPDEYHNWVCVPFVLDEETKTNGAPSWGFFEVFEPNEIEL